MGKVGETFLEHTYNEISDFVRQSAETVDPKKAQERAYFMKVKLPMLGLTVPQIRKLAKAKFSFSHQSFSEQFAIWNHVWFVADCHEISLLPIYYLEGLDPLRHANEMWPLVAPWASNITCWDQSDGLSGIFAKLLEENPDLVFPKLVAWNDSSNPWQRRQSLVSLFYYQRHRKVILPPEKVLPLVKARLDDPDYYVQKGLGWCLREAYQAWPEAAQEFLVAHGSRLAPAAWQAATEKLPPPFKAELKATRSAARKARRTK